MLKRIISGACYVAILLGFFCLRQFVDHRLFDILIWFFAVVGTFEICRALKGYTAKGSTLISMIFALFSVPVFVAVQSYLLKGRGYLVIIDLLLVMLLILSVTSLFQKVSINGFFASALTLVYPTVLLLAMLLMNEFPGEKGFIALLLSFVISPLSDTTAFFTGKAIGGKKLCPKISPKKTWAGAIGGTIGGILGSVAVYFIFKPVVNFFSPVLLFVLVGFGASVVNIFGDLCESLIKRKVGIKDMGKIMPGHGGVLDRIDGTLFVTVFLYLVFLFV